nr:PREDICTED: protein croquemort-like isoform X1 [Bemisia tabaci]
MVLRCLGGTLLGLGICLLLGGMLIDRFWPFFFSNLVQPQLALTSSSLNYGLWKETPVPLYMDFYFFDWMNPKQSLAGQEKPRFIERGPYVFREFHTKKVLAWNKNHTVTYKQTRKWVFMRSMSVSSLDDVVTTVNPIAFTIASLMKDGHLGLIAQEEIKIALEVFRSKMYMKRPIRQLLFEGYDDPLLKLLDKVPTPLRPLPNPLGSSHFGWFYPHNMSSKFDGVSNVDTGADDLNSLGDLEAWNYNAYEYFRGECGRVRGTTGEIWPLDSAKKTHITLFVTDLCSSLDLRNSAKEVSVQGLRGVTFIGGENVFDNGTVEPGNSCYWSEGKAMPSGVRSLSSCRFGAPALVSFPHFYLADPAYVTAVQGLSPSVEKHQLKITLEQDTGIPLAVNARLQINIQSSPTQGLINMFRNLPTVTLPVLWLEQRMTMTSRLAWTVWGASIGVAHVSQLLLGVSVVGAVFLLIGLLLLFKNLSNGLYKKSDDIAPLLSDVDLIPAFD